MQKFITTCHAAKIVNVSEAAVRQMVNRGALVTERTESGTRLFRRGRRTCRCRAQRAPERAIPGSPAGRPSERRFAGGQGQQGRGGSRSCVPRPPRPPAAYVVRGWSRSNRMCAKGRGMTPDQRKELHAILEAHDAALAALRAANRQIFDREYRGNVPR